MVIIALIAIAIGLLMVKYSRWHPLPDPAIRVDADAGPKGFGCTMVLVGAFVVAVAVMVGLWLYVAGLQH